MALAIDSRQQQSQFNAMNYDALRFAQPPPAAAPQQPQFTNPWVSSPAHAAGMYGTTALPATTAGGDPKHYATHTAPVSHAYTGAQLPAPSLATGILPLDSGLLDQTGLQFAQDGLGAHRSYGASYGVSTAHTGSTYASAAPPQYAYGYQADRRASHPSVASNFFLGDAIEEQKFRQDSLIDFPDRFHTATEAERQSFSDALDASRGMVAMSQSDITPRNIYGVQGSSSRNSSDSYGFPSSHSAHSSISSASTYPSYYNSSVSEASVGDYSSASESVDMPSSRTLPRPDRLMGGNLPPVPQSMMGQFSSKVSSSSQKKHKCKICDKRFTRPSSLQTHMYSHTGEKPFACDVEGCGRHFSVVSNLRRHRKVHRGEGRDPSSPDDED